MNACPSRSVTASVRVHCADAHGRVELVPGRLSGCGGCHGLCATPGSDRGARSLGIDVPGDWQVGDDLYVDLPAGLLLETALVLYAPPVLGLLLGAGLGSGWLDSDLASVLLGVAGLALSVGLAAPLRARLESRVASSLIVRHSQ